MKKNISVVIPHYQTPTSLKKMLKRLESSDFHLEIVVVDNESKNLNFKKEFPHVTWIENKKNKGFSFACNQGFHYTSARWILFLNPDITISAKQVYELFHWAENNNYDAISPDLNSSNYEKPLPTVISLLKEFTPLNKLPFSFNEFEQTLVGGCLLIRRKVLESLGGWDERFFLWFEDSDLTLRLIQKEYKIGFAPIEVQHIGGESVKKLSNVNQRQIFFHSLDIFVRKHFSPLQQSLIRNTVIKRFSKYDLYPVINEGVTWVVPNMDERLLEDFLKTNLKFFGEDELVIVSSRINKKVWKLRQQYPNVRFIPIDINKGFSTTVNVGLRASSTAFIGTINDDVILHEASLTNLYKYLGYPFGSLNPVIYSLDQQIESAGVSVYKKGKARPIISLPTQAVETTDASNAACVLYSHQGLKKVGLFDEKFESYLEDIDLSLRLSRAGFSNYVVRDSRLIHAKHQTSKRLGRYKRFLDMKNWWLVIVKNWTITDTLIHFPFILIERVRNISGFLK